MRPFRQFVCLYACACVCVCVFASPCSRSFPCVAVRGKVRVPTKRRIEEGAVSR